MHKSSGTAGPSRGLRAREVRQAIIWRSRKGQGCYGSAQTITRRCRSSLDLSAFAKGPASRISRAPAIRCATKMNAKHEWSGVKSKLPKAAALPQGGVANWRRRSSGLHRGLERDTRLLVRMNRETFSKSFSKGVRNGSSLQWPSYLILFGKSRTFEPKNGHEPPDSDLRLQLQTSFGEGVTNSQTPSASKSASNFLTRRNSGKTPKYSGTTC